MTCTKHFILQTLLGSFKYLRDKIVFHPCENLIYTCPLIFSCLNDEIQNFCSAHVDATKIVFIDIPKMIYGYHHVYSNFRFRYGYTLSARCTYHYQLIIPGPVQIFRLSLK